MTDRWRYWLAVGMAGVTTWSVVSGWCAWQRERRLRAELHEMTVRAVLSETLTKMQGGRP